MEYGHYYGQIEPDGYSTPDPRQVADQRAYEAKQEKVEQLWWEELATRSFSFAADAAAKRLERLKARSLDCAHPAGGRFPGRCRKCVACLKKRAKSWVARAKSEFFMAKKVWWVTLTLRPGEEAATYRGFQKWIRHLRKGGLTLRYLVSEETGEQNGRLHWHVALFGGADLTQKVIDTWPHGFTHRWLARGVGLVAYMAKYLGKVGRIRASLSFGDAERCMQLARPDLYGQLLEWLGGGPRPEWVFLPVGAPPSKYRITWRWGLSPPF